MLNPFAPGDSAAAVAIGVLGWHNAAMAAAPQWAEVAKGVLAIAQVVAILVAAVWAYFKFARGRTFAERLEASVDATPFQRRGISALRIRASATNTGASIVYLKDHAKIVRVYATALADATPGVSLDWGKHLVVMSVLTDHNWIEAQETVSEELLAAVPYSGRLAYRVELVIGSKKNKRWSASAIVPTADVEERRNQVLGLERAEQTDMPPEEDEKLRQQQEEQKRRDEEERKRREQKKATPPTPSRGSA